MSATDTGKTSIHPKLSPTPNPSSNATSRKAQSCKGSRMFKVPTNWRPALRALVIAASALLFLYLVWHAGPLTLWQHLQRLGWGFSLVLALAGVSHLAKTWAWQMTLGQERHKFTFPRLVGLRLGAEAAGQLGILGQTVGGSIRGFPLGSGIQIGTSLASG